MRDMEAQSVDLILTSPPYDNLRKYGSGSAFDFPGVAEQCKRLLKPGGVLVWVVGDETRDGSESGTSFRQALHFKEIGLKLRDTMIYEKENPVHSGDKSHYQNAFEFMFVLTNRKPAAINILTEPCKHAGKVYGKSSHREGGGNLKVIATAGTPVRDVKARTNIWTYPVGVEKVKGHPAVFPLQLAIDHILSWTNPGDTVLDCFAGSGTTLEACIKTDRHGIGIEKHEPYLRIAEKRCSDARNALPLFAEQSA